MNPPEVNKAMGSLFSSTQRQKQNSTQTTQNNLWDDPNLQTFLQGYNQQYSGPNISQVSAPANSWMTGAADAQSGVAGNLTPAFGTASALAGTGIDPGTIQQWMNPFENNVIQNLQNDFAYENARELANIRGRAARTGALGNSTNAVSERLATDSARYRLDRQITNARLAGWQQASGMNLQDAQTQLAASGQLGALTNAATGANMGTGSLGQNIWQTNLASTMLPYQLYNQGIQGYQGLGGLAGSTSTGQSTGTTTATPSIGSTILGGLGTLMTGMPSGGFNPFGWFGGGSKADGGAVTGRMAPYRNGGSSFADKVKDAHRAVEEMRKGGGRVEKKEGYASGGAAPWSPFPADPRVPDMGATPDMGLLGWLRRDDWTPPQQRMTPYRPDASEFTQAPAPALPPMTPVIAENPMQPFGRPMEAYERPMTADLSSMVSDRAAYGPTLEELEQPAGITASIGLPGSVPSVRPNKPAYTRDPGEAEIGPARELSRGPGGGWFGEGIWAGERATPMQRFGMALTQVGGRDAPWAGFGASMMGQMQQSNQERQAQLAADRLARDMELQRARLIETERHNRATEDNRNRNRPDTAFDTAIAQASAKDLESRAANVRSGQERLGRLDQLDRLLSDPNVPQGRFAGWELEGRRVAAALFPGFDPAGIAEAQAAQAITNQLALSLRSTAGGEGMPGAMSDQDREFLLRSIPRLENTREGNRVMIDMMRRAEDYKIAANTAAMNYIQARRTNVGLGEYMADWMRQNPMVTPELRQRVDTVAPQSAEPAVGTRQVREGVTYERRADGLWHPVGGTP